MEGVTDENSEYLASLTSTSLIFSQLVREQILKEIAFYSRYLAVINDLVAKRQSQVDSYHKVASTRPAQGILWGSEKSLAEMRKKIRKITKKQLRDFTIIS